MKICLRCAISAVNWDIPMIPAGFPMSPSLDSSDCSLQPKNFMADDGEGLGCKPPTPIAMDGNGDSGKDATSGGRPRLGPWLATS